MKKIIFIALLTMLTFSTVTAQEKNAPMNTENVTPAEYPGGLDAFYSYITSNVKDAATYKGKMMIITFTVETDGSLNGVKILKSLNRNLDKQVIALIKNSKQWTPGSKEGVTLRLEYNLPLRF
jgi:protein TonB